MRLEFSFDDGNVLDIQKTAPLLEKYGYRATFFIPNFFKGNPTLSKREIMELVDRGHSVGGHTKDHPEDLKVLIGIDLEQQIVENKKYLEEIVQKKLNDFCYPRGRHNDLTIEAVRNAGFTSARTTTVGHFQDDIENDFKKPTTVHVANRKEYGQMTPIQYFKIMLERAENSGNGYMHIWGHSEEIDRLGLWDQFEEMLSILRDKNYESIYS